MKLVIADRAAILVDTVYSDYNSYTGLAIVFATVIYGIQIYCDFLGYSFMAMGAAEMLGITLPDNFDTPYFSMSIKEFWRRWHISLSSWLRDYVYVPLGGSCCSKTRKYINLMLTFLVSGIWHGSKWSFVTWGLLHGIYQVTGEVTSSFRQRLCKKLGIDTDTGVWKALQMLVTFVLVDFAWLFFRADGLKNGLRMCKRILTQFHPLSLLGGTLYRFGLDEKDFRLLLCSIGFLFIVDLLTYRGVRVRSWFWKQNWFFREAALSLAVLWIILVGIWGNSYNAANFIYFQF